MIGIHRAVAIVPLLLMLPTMTPSVTAIDPVQLVVQLAPFLNWPAVEIPDLYAEHQDAAAAISSSNRAGLMPICSVRSPEVRDEVLCFLDRVRRSSMASACSWILVNLASDAPPALLRRSLALTSILELFQAIASSPGQLDHLQAVVGLVRQQMRSFLALGSDQFIDLLAHVFVRDAGRLLHRIVWTDHGLGSESQVVIEFIRGHYLSTAKLAPILQLYGSAPSPSYSLLTWALITLFRLIPFPNDIELMGPESSEIMAEMRMLESSWKLKLPASLSISWTSVRDAFYEILQHRESDNSSAIPAISPLQRREAIFDSMGFIPSGSSKGITNLLNASPEKRLARCVALRIVLTLMEHLSYSDLFPSLDVPSLRNCVSARYYQEVFELFRESIPLDIMHQILHFIRNFVEVSLTKATQLNLAMFLSRDRPHRLFTKEKPDLTGLLVQLQPSIKFAEASDATPTSLEFMKGMDSARDSVSNDIFASNDQLSLFCRNLMDVVFRTSDHINPFDSDLTLLQYQQDALSKFPDVSDSGSDRHALLADYLSLRAVDLAFGDESVYALTMKRLKEMDKDVDLLGYMDDHNSLQRSQFILLRLSDFRSVREPTFVTEWAPVAQALGDQFSASIWEIGTSSASDQIPPTPESVAAYCSPLHSEDPSLRAIADPSSPRDQTDAAQSPSTLSSISVSAHPFVPSYAGFQTTSTTIEYNSMGAESVEQYHASGYAASQPSTTNDHLASAGISEQRQLGQYVVAQHSASDQASSYIAYSNSQRPISGPLPMSNPMHYPVLSMPVAGMSMARPGVAYFPPQMVPPLFPVPMAMPVPQEFGPATPPAFVYHPPPMHRPVTTSLRHQIHRQQTIVRPRYRQ